MMLCTWLLCHDDYPNVGTDLFMSVCVGFLYTLMGKVLSGSYVTTLSKNGIEPSGCLSSTVNLMDWSVLLICLRKVWCSVLVL